jgi:hypothetical protein
MAPIFDRQNEQIVRIPWDIMMDIDGGIWGHDINQIKVIYGFEV